MNDPLFSQALSYFAAGTKNNFIPSDGFLFLVLVVGALLTAGAALLIFTFYEDFYWSDPKFREQLRLNRTAQDFSSRKRAS